MLSTKILVVLERHITMLSSCLILLILKLVSTSQLPNGTLGFYSLIADDTFPNYTSESIWQPILYPYQIYGSNVAILTFINPQNMPAIPPGITTNLSPISNLFSIFSHIQKIAMAALAKCKGQPGCPLISTKVIFSIGGYAYSSRGVPWLQSQSAAESMAAKVAVCTYYIILHEHEHVQK